jgi:hypothetical protein
MIDAIDALDALDALDAFDALHGVMSQIKWRGFGNRNINLIYGRWSKDYGLWSLVYGF